MIHGRPDDQVRDTHPDRTQWFFFDNTNLDDSPHAVMAAGSILFFDASTVHGSEPNESTERRRVLVFTYQPGAGRMFKTDAKREVGSWGEGRAPSS